MIIKTTDNIIKEEISIAFLRAICAEAGVTFNELKRDVQSKDGTITTKKVIDNKEYILNIDVQLKSTSSKNKYYYDENFINYKLNIKNYNDLVAKRSNEIILCLLIIPDFENVVIETFEELKLTATMYWMSLKGEIRSDNKSDITIKIPKNQIINSSTIINLLEMDYKEEFNCD